MNIGGADRLWNRSFSQLSTSVTLTLERSYDIQWRSTHRPLPTYQILFKSEKHFVNGKWTNIETGFITSTRRSKAKHPNLSWAACQMVEDMPVCYCRSVAFWTTQHWI